MTTLLMRAGAVADEVRAEAAKIDPVKVAVTLLMVVPFVLGWLAAKTVRAVWAAVSWLWAAAVVGWRTASQPGGGKT